MVITKRLLCFLALGLFLLTDRFLKSLAEVLGSREINLIPQISHFGYYLNHHFLFFLELPPLLGFGVILAAFVLLFVFFFEKKLLNPFPFYCLFTGALSNFYDRVFKEGVVDFIKIFNLSTFNFADILILIGFIFLFYNTLKFQNKNI